MNDARTRKIRAGSDLRHDVQYIYRQIPQQTRLCGAHSGLPQLPRLPDLDCSAVWSRVRLSLSCRFFFLKMCHYSRCPSMSWHMTSFTRPSPCITTAVSNTEARRPGYEATDVHQEDFLFGGTVNYHAYIRWSNCIYMLDIWPQLEWYHRGLHTPVPCGSRRWILGFPESHSSPHVT